MKKKSKLEKLTPMVLGVCMLSFLAACGSDDDDNDSVPQNQEQQQEGRYQVTFTPVNSNLASGISGTATFSLAGDEFEADVDMSGAPAGTHPQYVYAGTACPGANGDANGDGFVDVVEASASAGAKLVPLDSDLRSQDAGGRFPMGTSYDYDESTSYLTMLADLRLPDSDTSDSLTKLGADEELNLEGRVVMIHGIPASTILPATVMGLEGMSAQQTLPIACGVITRVAQEENTTGGTTGTTGGTTGTTGGTTGTTGGTTGTTGGTTGTTGN